MHANMNFQMVITSALAQSKNKTKRRITGAWPTLIPNPRVIHYIIQKGQDRRFRLHEKALDNVHPQSTM